MGHAGGAGVLVSVGECFMSTVFPFSLMMFLNTDNDWESGRLDMGFEEYLSCLGEMVCRDPSHLSL